MAVKLLSTCVYLCEQFTTENAELQEQIMAMKETQQEFIAEVSLSFCITVILVTRKYHFTYNFILLCFIIVCVAQ